jgi:hypothetical protein
VKRYNISISPTVDLDLERLATKLGIPKSEVVLRAVVLYKHAVDADGVKLVKNGEDQTVLIK